MNQLLFGRITYTDRTWEPGQVAELAAQASLTSTYNKCVRLVRGPITNGIPHREFVSLYHVSNISVRGLVNAEP